LKLLSWPIANLMSCDSRGSPDEITERQVKMVSEVSFLLAFGAGLLSFASPCVLPIVPIYVAHLIGTQGVEANNRAIVRGLAFVMGFSIIFIILGASVGFVGFIIRDQLPILQKVAGVLLVILGLHLLGIFRIPVFDRTWKPQLKNNTRASVGRSFLMGAAFATGWTPCIGPILGSILALAATTETAARGATLMVFYSAGLAVPFLATSFALEWWTKVIRSFSRHLPKVEAASGALIIVVGVLVFSNRLTILNQYFDFFGLGAGI